MGATRILSPQEVRALSAEARKLYMQEIMLAAVAENRRTVELLAAYDRGEAIPLEMEHRAG